jgi:hypothetical protein
MWLRQVGQGAVLVCLGDEDDLILPALLSLTEERLGIRLSDGRPDGVLTTQLGEELVLFNRNDEPRTVEVEGKPVHLAAYSEETVPLARVPVAAPGPRIEAVDLRQEGSTCHIRVRASEGAARGYVEVRRPDYRTVYRDLQGRGNELTVGLETARPGRYFLFIHLQDERGRPTSCRRFEGEIS